MRSAMQHSEMRVIALPVPPTRNGLHVRSVVEGTDQIIAQTAQAHSIVHRHCRLALGHFTGVGYLHDQAYESFSTSASWLCITHLDKASPSVCVKSITTVAVVPLYKGWV